MSVASPLMDDVAECIPEERDQVRDQARIKGLTVLESDDDLLRLMRAQVRIQRLQVIIQVLPALSSKQKSATHPLAQASLTHSRGRSK